MYKKGSIVFEFLVAILLVVILGWNAYLVSHQSAAPIACEPQPGGGSSPDHYFQENFLQGLIEGGGIRATSTTGSTMPLVLSDFDVETVIDATLNQVDATISFPASSTLANFLPRAGDTKTLLIRNASTTATMDLTVAGGTGVLLKNATSTAQIRGDSDGANFATVKLTRKANRDIEALLDIFTD